ncbi:carboxypeptidase-like regulatory domain-containing protein [Maribacter sp. SA7]|uniref:TonB-dependent receptor n=1 Tax=Maribacter zhoushanensis TaxID=3030012 RepID=UPI0023EDB263|nr:carboxypeptidase-like regulatory domain-containing protein [Maribacter zhoushanensis]MDF4204244.1 carboxypeptidase-like regulatory domain-containing protein [Maribacter zhoushanensis]
MKLHNVLSLILLLCSSIAFAQNATISGIVLGDNNEPLPNVNISSKDFGTTTNSDGFYILEITSDIENTIVFSHIAYLDVVLEKLILNTNETFEFNPVLKSDVTQIDGVTVSATGEKEASNILNISPEKIRKIPGANSGVETILKLLPGVSSNNELSTQYAVRGGNYDENLVYVNEIEVYRPFLIRSAQQEGLSFVNSDLVQNVKFSAGGFQAKYGDKLASVLDIKYKTPTLFSLRADVSFLGASASLETVSKNQKLSSVSGIRYRNNSLLVNSQQTESNFNPAFTDIQSYLTYRFSPKFQLNFLGNLAINDYKNEPLNRQTNFGTIDNPQALVVYYQGQETNKYTTALGALKGSYYLNENTTLKLISSIYHTTEEEYSDVVAAYELGDVDSNLGSDTAGEVLTSRGIGSQFNRTRNDLDALIFNLEHKGSHTMGNSVLEWGAKYTHEDIRDQLRESEFIDSAGFSIRPPRSEFINNQPSEPFDAPLEAYSGLSALNFVKTNRFSGYAQLGTHKTWSNADVYYNIGVRSHHWTVSGTGVEKVSQTVLSPRAQFAIKPNWNKDMLFRLSTGVYHQPPFYRELRDKTGTIQPNVKAQKSFHIVAGNEYSFLLWDRPFTLITEGYYKKLENVNAYTLEDVRIRYAANNEAEAYVYGAEVRLNGAFVPGTESWVSLGYLKTEENRNNRGYIPRPTDQRVKFGILFQDYIPTIPDLKMYLNLVYQTGVPGGSPSYADPYIFQNRLRDYKRADLGISYIFANKNKQFPKTHWLSNFKELSLGFEIFNLFNNQNSITNTWVRDADSKNEYTVPNYLTSRVLNLKLGIRL